MSSLQTYVKKIFGTQNDRYLKSIQPLVVRINELEASIQKLTDAQLAAKTAEFKEQLGRGRKLDEILPEAFAVMREAAKRVIGQRHYDVQLIGGITLHKGRIAEMKTGEGKTLVATLPSYLNALTGRGVHVITVNDYLARRDSEWMGRIHRFLGLKTGNIIHGLNDRQRKEQYGADITYGTNNEFGFDYLRDNMKFRLEDYVQREHHFAIVDEVDSILIDEARTPLIISGPAEASTDLYTVINKKLLESGGLKPIDDYTVDEKSKTAALTEAGVEKMEKRLGVANLYDPAHIETLHHVNQALKAHVIFKRDVDYLVKDGEVIIVDEFTGRMMTGRRWSDGLHQAVEAKEGVTIENENQTLATITLQNYFRMYEKLSGMTGTADTEATEFKQIYKLDVTVIPTNKNMVRKDNADVIFKSESAKFKAIAEEIKKLSEKGQPVLVGTVSVDKSERLSELLKRENVRHEVLNAKNHQREATIVAQAGRKASVTISTNMAGRGTDILLGGDPERLARAEAGLPDQGATEEQLAEKREEHEAALKKWKTICEGERVEVREAGGLFILGTERHESRRIDNQLRGRAGRQGDPGGSRFYLSLDDDLMRIFGGERIKGFMEDDVPIEHRWINKAIENAQKKVEGHNYDIRKHLLEYDDVMNQQRKVIYGWRREVLQQPNLRDMIFSMVGDLSSAITQDFFPNGKLAKKNGVAQLDEKELNDAVSIMFAIPSKITEHEIMPFNDKGLSSLLMKTAEAAYREKEAQIGQENMRHIERMVLLSTIDHLWKDHLLAMDHLREGIGLRGYGQKDPLVEYKKEAFRFFEMMMNQITGDVVRKVFAVQLTERNEFEDEEAFFEQERPQNIQYNLSEQGELISKNPSPSAIPPKRETRREAPGLSAPRRINPNDSRVKAGRGPLPGLGGASNGGAQRPQAQPVGSAFDKVGRNDLCPCGSGKKFKKCHGS